MADHTNTNLLEKKSSKSAESFSTFLDEIPKKFPKEFGLAVGDGAIYLAHKNVFKNIQIQDIIGMNVSIINGKGTADFKLMTPGTVIPQLPVHINLSDDDREYNVQRLSPWTIILKGGEHLGAEQNEKYLNYNTVYDRQLINFSQTISAKVRNNKFRSMCYGQSENICTDPSKLKNSTIDTIFKHAFGFIPKDEHDDYVLYVNGTHLMYVLYSMYCLDNNDSKVSKQRLYMSQNSFTVNVDNQHLICGQTDEIKQMFICPLHLGTNNIFMDENCTKNVLGSSNNPYIEDFNKTFKDYLSNNVDKCREFPVDKFVASMFSSLTMEVMLTPFQIKSKPNDTSVTLFKNRLNFIATHMLGAKGLKGDEIIIPQNDKISAMLVGAAVQLQLSPTDFRCFRKNLSKDQLGKDPFKSNWIPNEHSTIHWNTSKYLEVNEDHLTSEDKNEIMYTMAYDSCIFNFMTIADRMNIYNCEMFLNNKEWATFDRNSSDLRQNNLGRKEAVRRTREKCFCEYMKKCCDIPYTELLFLRQNCNIFRYKSNILYPAHYILNNTDVNIKHEDIEQCVTCNRSTYSLSDKSFCFCYLFYSASCSLMQPGKRQKISAVDIERTKSIFYNTSLITEKFSEKSSYKNTHYVPIIDGYGTVECNGGIRIKRPLPEGSKAGNSKSETPNTDSVMSQDEIDKMEFAQSPQLSTIMRTVDAFLEPLFTERYTMPSTCNEKTAICSSTRTQMITCEDIEVNKLIQDHLLQACNVPPLFTSDEPMPPAPSIPSINNQNTEIYNFHQHYTFLQKQSEYINRADDSYCSNGDQCGTKRKQFEDDSNYDPCENIFGNVSASKKTKNEAIFSEAECDDFIHALMYSLLNKNTADDRLVYHTLKDEVNFTEMSKKYKNFLSMIQKVHKKKGGKHIAKNCLSLKEKLIKNVCKTYFELIGIAMTKTFSAVAKTIDFSPEQLDSEFDTISIFESDFGGNNNNSNSNQKTKFKATVMLDINAPNSVVKRSTTMTYYGHLRHQLDVSINNDKKIYPECKSMDSRIANLTIKNSIPAEDGQLVAPLALQHVEKSMSNLPPLLKLLDPINETLVTHAQFISPPKGKISTEITELNFGNKTSKAEETESSYYDENVNNIGAGGYVPCPLINCDKPEQVKLDLKYCAVVADDLLPTIRKESVRLLDLISDSFMSPDFHENAVKYVHTYLSKLNCQSHSSHESILPPMMKHVIDDVGYIIRKISWLSECAVYIYDIFAGKNDATDLKWPEITTKYVIQIISEILADNKIISGYFHLYCLMTELYGDTIGVSHTPHYYNISLERRASWIKTFCRAFLRLRVDNGGPKQLKWKTLKTFLADNGLEKNKNLLVTTMNHDIVPSHGSYLMTNMLYGAYCGREPKSVFRYMSFGDQFFSGSLFSNILGLNRNYTGNQIVVGRHALYKNWSKRTTKKIDIDTLLNQITVSSLIDFLDNSTITINDLVEYYVNKNIVPKENIAEQKNTFLLECLDIHSGMIQENYEKRLYLTSIFPKVWNILIGKCPSASDDDDDDNSEKSDEEIEVDNN